MTRCERLPAAAAIVMSLTALVSAQPPTLEQVLDRAASYVSEFERQLTAIAADEEYVQLMGIPGRHGAFIATTRRQLKATLMLIREPEEGYLEVRDVIDVDGVPVPGHAATPSVRMPADLSHWSVADRQRLRDENARYNIGDVVRTINTPLLTLQVLQRRNQPRFVFSAAVDRSPAVSAPSADAPGAFQVSTDVWVIAFQERRRGTLVHTRDGKDVPSKGRVWIDAESGRVMMTEMVVENSRLRAEVTVSFKSEALLGLLPPVEMSERYRAMGRRQTIIEATARYGLFHVMPSARE